MNTLKQNIPWYLLALVLLFGFKWYFMGDSVNLLHWILLPVTFLVKLFSGLHFAFEPNNGYVNELYNIVIDKNCSGINFMAVVFLMGNLGFMHCVKTNGRKLLFLIGIAVLAYLSSLLINSSRIVVAIQFLAIERKLTDLTNINFHKLLGILFYGLALFGIYGLLEWLLGRE